MRNLGKFGVFLAFSMGLSAGTGTAAAATFGSAALPRSAVDFAYQITFIDTAHPAPVTGFVTSWTVYSGTANSGATLQIWRKVGTDYRLIGQNDVRATTTGVIDFPISGPDQIAIEAGDLLGFRYGYSSTASRMITLDFSTGGVIWTDWPTPGNDVAVGGILPESQLVNRVREYSLSATIAVPEPSVALGTLAAGGLLAAGRRARRE
jgi:hypothetical protein